jgi:exosortase K
MRFRKTDSALSSVGADLCVCPGSGAYPITGADTQVCPYARHRNSFAHWIAQCVLVLLCAFALKRYYSTATVEELRWILAPTTALVELLSGVSFEFEAHAGYLSRERGFLIAGSCAGVNFLLTAFLLLTLGKLLREREQQLSWGFIPTAAVIAYLVTLFANTARIYVALWLQRMPVKINGLNASQLHRLEGIVIYFGFLLLLFVVSEKIAARKTAMQFRQSFIPLLVYYAVALGVPLLNGAYRQGSDFWAHSLVVLLVPLLLMLPFALIRASSYLRLPGIISNPTPPASGDHAGKDSSRPMSAASTQCG